MIVYDCARACVCVRMYVCHGRALSTFTPRSPDNNWPDTMLAGAHQKLSLYLSLFRAPGLGPRRRGDLCMCKVPAEHHSTHSDQTVRDRSRSKHADGLCRKMDGAFHRNRSRFLPYNLWSSFCSPLLLHRCQFVVNSRV
jgi:hypothetical protein